MQAVRCPSCSLPLTQSERTAASCPSCGQPLSGAESEERAARPTDPWAGTGPQHSWCQLCRSAQSVSVCYLRATGQVVGISGVQQRWVNIRCTCCASCFRGARRLQTLRYAIVAFWIAFPLVALFGAGWLIEQLGVPMSVFGGVLLAAMLIWILSLFAAPLYIRQVTRRRLAKLLDPALDERLKGVVGVRAWGWLHYVTALRHLPARERFVELSTI
jgi:hypothetical protein